MRLLTIEGGGTKHRINIWKVGQAPALDASGAPADRWSVEAPRVPTTSGEGTYREIISWLEGRGPFDAIGVATFGPVDVRRGAPTHGLVQAPNKPHGGWEDFSILAALRAAFGDELPILIDNDANANLRAEVVYGCGRDESVRSLYFIINGGGTGGALGLKTAGYPRIVTGSSFDTEIGSTLVALHDDDRSRYGERFEPRLHVGGLIRAEDVMAHDSFARRRGREAREVPVGDATWDAVAFYAAQLCNHVLSLAAPDRIVFAGGIALGEGFDLGRVAEHIVAMNSCGGGGFIPALRDRGAVRGLLRKSALGGDVGVYGALTLAREAALSGISR